jgi:lipoate-protein ligase A
MKRSEPWSLLLDGNRSAAYNMAKDEYCLELTRRSGRPMLRLYGWERFVLSVGRAQQVSRQVNLAACAEAGVPMVRRITGGRAVLHGNDLTYAVTAPTALEDFQGGILPIYRRLSRVFAAFLRELGHAPEVKAYAGRERAALASPICFSTPSAFEILVGGRKLVGSAQRQLPRAFLQHGSIPLAPQDRLLARLFLGTSREAVRAQMTDLETLGVRPGLSDGALRERLVASFGRELGIGFEPAPWGEAEEREVLSLLDRYPALLPAQHPSTPGNAAGPTAGAR